MASYNPYQEDPVLLHRALLNCLRKASSCEDRRSYLCITENIIAQKTGVPVRSPFFSHLHSSAEVINRNLCYEIQQIKMEDQVEFLELDNSPPEEVGAMGNMVGDDNPTDVIDQNGRSSSECSVDDDDFIDLTDLINDDSPNEIVIQREFPEPAALGFGIVTPNDNNNVQPPLNQLDLSGQHPGLPPASIPLPAEVPSPLDQTAFNNDTHTPVNHTPSPLSAVSRPPNGYHHQSRAPLTAPVSRPPMSGLETIPLSVMNHDPLTRAPLNRGNSVPGASRPPGNLVTSSESRIPLVTPPNFPNGVHDSPTSPVTRVPGQSNILPITRIPGQLPASSYQSPVTRVPGLDTNMDICNSVPKLPITLSRPKGFLPPTTPENDSVFHDIEPRLRKTRSTSSDTTLHDTSGDTLRTYSGNSLSTYETRPLPSPGAGATTRDYPNEVFRQHSSSAEGGQVRDKNRSSSSEGGNVTQPDTHRGSTVYRSKRITHLQLLAFLENASLKAELKELGAFYMISSCEEPKYYNISLSGPPHNINQIKGLFDSVTDPDSCSLITHEILSDPEEPGSIALALGTGRYICRVLQHLNPNVDIIVREDTFVLKGTKRNVYEAARLIEYFLESPRKRVGTLFHIPDEELDNISDIRAVIARKTRFSKGKIAEMTDVKTSKTYVFCLGIPQYENQYGVNTYLNDIFYNSKKSE